jgi:hypothetical protein
MQEPVRPHLVLAAAASLGAGGVHAVAAGAHGEHRQAALLFTALAALQLVWGALALVRRTRTVAALGVVLGAAAVTGWLLAKTTGLPVEGLEGAEPVQTADAAAAALATGAALLALSARRLLPLLPGLALVCAVALVGAATTSSHEHAGAAAHEGVAHAEPVPYDPALPIDLGGTPGVTPQQQASAESLVAVTLARLPRWADAQVAERAGFRSIGDGFTGTEHLISQEFLEDDVVLDPDRPESLVYDTSTGDRRLVAAMYMLRPGTPLDRTPDVGGALVQWHTHEDLCFTRSGRVAGIVDASGACPTGLVKPALSPMVHVWITSHECGPFAALEGIAGGQIPEGEERLCDHAHGAAG